MSDLGWQRLGINEPHGFAEQRCLLKVVGIIESVMSKVK